MIQHGVFAVAEHAVTTASATSAEAARTRALGLYRQWQKAVNYNIFIYFFFLPHTHYNYKIRFLR